MHLKSRKCLNMKLSNKIMYYIEIKYFKIKLVL